LVRAEDLAGQALAAAPGNGVAHNAKGQVLRAQREGAEIAETTLDTERRQPERFGSGCAAWSGLTIVTVRPTVFLEGFFVLLAAVSVRDADELALPMGGNGLS
jgi:hypothetical protein